MTHRALELVDNWIAENIILKPDPSPQRVHEYYAALLQAGEAAGITAQEMNDTFQIPGALLGWLTEETLNASSGKVRDKTRIVE